MNPNKTFKEKSTITHVRCTGGCGWSYKIPTVYVRKDMHGPTYCCKCKTYTIIWE